jgi:hypothetical protein
LPYYPEAELFLDPFDAAERARSRSPPASPLPRPRSTASPPALHFPSSSVSQSLMTNQVTQLKMLILSTVSLLPQVIRSVTIHRSCPGRWNTSSTDAHYLNECTYFTNCVTFCSRRKKKIIQGNKWIGYETHFPFLSTPLTWLFKQRGTMSPWSTWTMRRLCAQHKMATTDHLFLCTDTVHAVRVQLTRQIPFRRCRHSFGNLSVVACSAASQYNVLPKKFNQYLFIPPPLNVDRSTHRHFTLLFSLLPFGFIFKVTLLVTPLYSCR